MIHDSIRIALAVLGFTEHESKPLLWCKNDHTKRRSSFADFRKGDRGNCYFSDWDSKELISLEKANPETVPPELLSFKQAETAFFATGKLPKEIEDAMQFRDGKDAKQGPQRIPSAPTKKEEPPKEPQSDPKHDGIYVKIAPSAPDFRWHERRFSEEDYRKTEEQTVKRNIELLESIAPVIAEEVKSGRLMHVSIDDAVLAVFETVKRHAHYEFERWATCKVLDEART